MAGHGEEGKVEVGRKSASVVWQDKGSVTLRYFAPASGRDFLLPPHNDPVTRRALHHVMRVTICNAPTERGNLNSRDGSRRLLGPFFGLAFALISAGLLTVSAYAFHLRISLTDSAAPAGEYRLIAAPAGRGDLVAACLPTAIARTGLTRGYLGEGDCPSGAEPVAKVIDGLPGDVIELGPERVAVNGVTFANSRTASCDSAGRLLPHAEWGTHRGAIGQVWLFGFNDARSWDARYFGPVPLAGVRGVLKPILTW